MFEPIRGGTRGGQAEFKWSDVSADKDRENYLGHSINAPTGRWQKNKDIHWYNRDTKEDQVARDEEIKRIKEAEAEALAVALGFTPAPKTTTSQSTETSNDPSMATNSVDSLKEDQRALAKLERRRQKAQRKEEKKAQKVQRKAERAGRGEYNDDGENRRERHPRSLSPGRGERAGQLEIRSIRDRRNRSRPPPERSYDADHYFGEHGREISRDWRRWEGSSRQDFPSSHQHGHR